MMARQIQGRTIAHLLVLLSIFTGINCKKFRFHLPWACAVLDNNGNLIGACTIFEFNKVLVSVDNFNETVPGSNPPKLFYEKVPAGEVYVHAGSNYMNVELVKPPLKHGQKVKAIKLYVAFKQHEPDWKISENPKKISPEEGAEYDAFGLAFNVGILETQEILKDSPYLKPVLTLTKNIDQETTEFVKRLRNQNMQTDAYACVTYSWSRKLNRIRYHEVMYIHDDSCFDAFCQWKLTNCWTFPYHNYQQCFKSTTFADVCPAARGAALYCPNFGKSVFAILTTAPSCGLNNMPGVYTTLSMVIKFFEEAYKTTIELHKRQQYDLYSLQQLNEDYEGIP